MKRMSNKLGPDLELKVIEVKYQDSIEVEKYSKVSEFNESFLKESLIKIQNPILVKYRHSYDLNLSIQRWKDSNTWDVYYVKTPQLKLFDFEFNEDDETQFFVKFEEKLKKYFNFPPEMNVKISMNL